MIADYLRTVRRGLTTALTPPVTTGPKSARGDGRGDLHFRRRMTPGFRTAPAVELFRVCPVGVLPCPEYIAEQRCQDGQEKCEQDQLRELQQEVSRFFLLSGDRGDQRSSLRDCGLGLLGIGARSHRLGSDAHAVVR